MTQQTERMNLVVVGHVDHGKSTVVGRLLADTDSLPDGKLDAVKAKCEKAGKRFEYAFLLDALIDEQAQGITIDAARIFFNTQKRDYIIIDAPGHIEFLKNMITGASHAEAAVLVIDAHEGVKENSRRHGYMLSLLGIDKVVVLVNKMDLVDYSQKTYDSIVKEYSEFLEPLGVTPVQYVPVSALEGEGIVNLSKNLDWYDGAALLEILDAFEKPKDESHDVFRMYVQDVYKFTRFGDSRRIVAGNIDTGNLAIGDEVVFYPSGKRSRVKSFEGFNTETLSSQAAGAAVGITLEEQVYIKRGELLAKAGEERPKVTTRIQCSMFWLGQKPLVTGRDYILKVGTSRVKARVESFVKIIDAGSLDEKQEGEQTQVLRNNVADCILTLKRPIAFDESSQRSSTSRFVILDGFHISGGGIIRNALEDSNSDLREKKRNRNKQWIRGAVSLEDRVERNSQKPMLLLITGKASSKRKELGKFIEAQLFAEGRQVYFTGIGSLVHGLDSDLAEEKKSNREHIRRLSEVANLMQKVGLIFVVSASELSSENVSMIQELVGFDSVRTVCLGDNSGSDLEPDLHVVNEEDFDSAYSQVKEMFYSANIFFRP